MTRATREFSIQALQAASPASPSLSLAYAEWMKARAQLAAMDAAASSDEAAWNAAQEAKRVALWRLIETPSEGLSDIKLRAESVQSIFMDVLSIGEPTDKHHMAALAGLISEVLTLAP